VAAQPHDRASDPRELHVVPRDPSRPKKVREIDTPEQFDTLYAQFPDNEFRLLVETGI
jgi:hypothetical protein